MQGVACSTRHPRPGTRLERPRQPSGHIQVEPHPVVDGARLPRASACTRLRPSCCCKARLPRSCLLARLVCLSGCALPQARRIRLALVATAALLGRVCLLLRMLLLAALLLLPCWLLLLLRLLLLACLLLALHGGSGGGAAAAAATRRRPARRQQAGGPPRVEAHLQAGQQLREGRETRASASVVVGPPNRPDQPPRPALTLALRPSINVLALPAVSGLPRLIAKAPRARSVSRAPPSARRQVSLGAERSIVGGSGV